MDLEGVLGDSGHQVDRNHGLTERVEAALRADIAQATAGDKLPPERELAERYGVSIVKVREALTLLAREGLVERSHGRGTFVCEPSIRQWVAIVLVHSLAHPSLSFYERVVFQSLRERLNAAGVPSRGYAAYGDPSTYDWFNCPEFLQDIEAGRVRHVIPIGGDLPPEVREALKQRNVARSLHDSARGIARQREMIQAGVRYLVSQGRRRLGMLAWMGAGGGWGNGWEWEGQAAVFKASLEAAGLECRRQWVRGDLHPNLAGAGWQEFRDIWRSGNGRPDGLLICNDVLARDAAIAITESGVRVPDDLLVVAHENKGSGQWFPFPVARLQVDPEQSAAALAQQALKTLGEAADDVVDTNGPTFRLIPLADRGPRMVGAEIRGPSFALRASEGRQESGVSRAPEQAQGF